MRQPVDTKKPIDARRRFAPGWVVRGGLLYTAGLTAREPDGTLVGPGDMTAQANRVTRNVLDVLEAAGLSADQLVKLVVYVTNIDAYDASRPATAPLYAARPVSTLIEVPRLQEQAMLIEIEAIAAVG